MSKIQCYTFVILGIFFGVGFALALTNKSPIGFVIALWLGISLAACLWKLDFQKTS